MIRVFVSSTVIAMIMLFFQVYLNKNLNDQLESVQIQNMDLTNQVDSIKNELFILDTEVHRYRIALEMLEYENPRAAAEFNKMLSMTE